jgi:hypothetical protein
MAVTTEKSTQVSNKTATPPVNNPAYNEGGDLKVFYFSFTQGSAAGDANSTADLLTMPPGKYRILLDQGNVTCSAFGASRTLDLGYTAYTNYDGTAVTADEDGFISAADISAAATVATSEALAAGADRTYFVDSKEGFTLRAKCAGGTIPVGATLKGYVVVAGA